MTSFKKISAVTAALMLAIASVSCSEKKSEESGSFVSDETVLCSFRAAKIGLADDFVSITTLSRNSSGSVLVFGETRSGGWTGYVTDGSFSDHKDFTFIPDDDETVISASLMNYGKKAVLTYSGGSTIVHIIGSDNSEENVLDCGEILEDNLSYGSVYCCSDGFVIADSHRKIYCFDKSGNGMGELKTDGKEIFGVTSNNSGGVSLLLVDREMNGYIADIDGTSVTDLKPCGKLDSSAAAMCAGAGGVDCAAMMYDGLYSFSGGNRVKVSDLTDAGISGYSVLSMVMTAENEFALLLSENGVPMLKLLTERDITELKAKKVIRVGTLNSTSIQNKIGEYNRLNEDGEYRAEMVVYETRYPDISGIDRLRLDIASGNAPDVITSSIPGIDFNGYFADLYEFMDKDNELSRDMFIPNILEAMEIDGKLPVICPEVKLVSAIAKSKYPHVRENWSYDDMIAAYNECSGEMVLDFNSSIDLMENNFVKYVNIYDFVDYNTGICNFEAPDFIKMMNFFRDNHIGITDDEFRANGEIDYGNASESLNVLNDTQLLTDIVCDDPASIWSAVNGLYRDSDPVFVGIPSADGCGSYVIPDDKEYAIMRNSNEPDGAWDFIKFLFSDDVYRKFGGRLNAPIIQSQFDKNAARCLVNDPAFKDMVFLTENEDEWPTYGYIDENGEYCLIETFTEEQVDYYKQFWFNACKRYIRPDTTLSYGIVKSELKEFFNSDKSAEETAKMIQNRASIYLSEQYS